MIFGVESVDLSYRNKRRVCVGVCVCMYPHHSSFKYLSQVLGGARKMFFSLCVTSTIVS